jgi:hypothetical protein
MGFLTNIDMEQFLFFILGILIGLIIINTISMIWMMSKIKSNEKEISELNDNLDTLADELIVEIDLVKTNLRYELDGQVNNYIDEVKHINELLNQKINKLKSNSI